MFLLLPHTFDSSDGVTVGGVSFSPPGDRVSPSQVYLNSLVIESHQFAVKLLWEIRSIGVTDINQPIDDVTD
jgi:hypothetical protein